MLNFFLIFISLLIIYILLVKPIEGFQSNELDIDYVQDVNIEGAVKATGDVTVNDRLLIDSITIGDVTLDKNKLSELVRLPLVNLTSICLKNSPEDNKGTCFNKQDIEFLRSIKGVYNSNKELYVRWQI